jgi:nucleotide-binding universal stress UspA family protein
MMAALPEWNDALHTVEREAITVQNIVLLLDATERTWSAIPVAQAFCDLYGATLHIVNLGNQDLNWKKGSSGLSSTGSKAPIFVEAGANPDTVLELVHRLPDALAVISTEVGDRIEKDRFGGFTESFFARRPERTVLVSSERGRTPWNLRHILLAHDGTPGSQVATNPAIDLAVRAKAEVIALHVAARGQERPEQAGSISAPIYFDQPQHEWPSWAQEFMNRMLATGAPTSLVHFKLAVTGGQAGSEVAQVARERGADLVVMAWHGRWDHENCATRVVVRGCGCPVLLTYSES